MLRPLVVGLTSVMLGASVPEASERPWAIQVSRVVSTATSYDSLWGKGGFRVEGIWNKDLAPRHGFQVRLGLTSIEGSREATGFQTEGTSPATTKVPMRWNQSNLKTTHLMANYRFAFRDQQTTPYLIAGLGLAHHRLATDISTLTTSHQVKSMRTSALSVFGLGMSWRQTFGLELSLQAGSLSVADFAALSCSYRF